MRHAIAMIFLLVANAANAAIYRCDDPVTAERVFQDTPCPEGKIERKFDEDPRVDSPRKKYGAALDQWVVAGVPERSSMDACVEEWRPLLKDPGSASITPGKFPGVIVEGAKDRHIIVEGRAKNGFGALGAQYFVCSINLDGTVVEGSGSRLTSRAEGIEKYGIKVEYNIKQ